MPDYDLTRYETPAPVAYLTIRAPETGASLTDVPFPLDTEADVSGIPRLCLPALRREPMSDRFLVTEAYVGREAVLEMVYVDVRFCERSFKGDFVVLDETIGILGRNVLNTVSLTLDGPRLTWDKSPDSPGR